MAAERERENDAALLHRLRHDTEVELGWIEGDCLISRDRYYEAILALLEALDVVDAPYPIEVFPDLQKREEVFAAMREINQYATEQFYAEVARQRGHAARSLIAERTMMNRRRYTPQRAPMRLDGDATPATANRGHAEAGAAARAADGTVEA